MILPQEAITVNYPIPNCILLHCIVNSYSTIVHHLYNYSLNPEVNIIMVDRQSFFDHINNIATYFLDCLAYYRSHKSRYRPTSTNTSQLLLLGGTQVEMD